jgi:hypothetical protein
MTHRNSEGERSPSTILPLPPLLLVLIFIAIRLTLQSDVFLRATDNKALHAPVKLTDDDRVLETATGTG